MERFLKYGAKVRKHVDNMLTSLKKFFPLSVLCFRENFVNIQKKYALKILRKTLDLEIIAIYSC